MRYGVMCKHTLLVRHPLPRTPHKHRTARKRVLSYLHGINAFKLRRLVWAVKVLHNEWEFVTACVCVICELHFVWGNG